MKLHRYRQFNPAQVQELCPIFECQVGTVNIFTNSQNPKGSNFEKTHQFKRRRIVIGSGDESQ